VKYGVEYGVHYVQPKTISFGKDGIQLVSSLSMPHTKGMEGTVSITTWKGLGPFSLAVF
jgi:hypothetical protein